MWKKQLMSTISNSKINNTNTVVAGAETFRCPINTCCERVVKIPTSVATHIKTRHPTLSNQMHLGRKYAKAYYCDICTKYSNAPHAVCHECGNPENGGVTKCFHTTAERDHHLKTNHLKWWLEYNCNNGDECHGIAGACGFNHTVSEKRFITNDEPIPSFLCRYEQPWNNIRCKRLFCGFDHLWGRVRALIKMRATGNTRSESTRGSNQIADANVDTNQNVDANIDANQTMEEEFNQCIECADTPSIDDSLSDTNFEIDIESGLRVSIMAILNATDNVSKHSTNYLSCESFDGYTTPKTEHNVIDTPTAPKKIRSLSEVLEDETSQTHTVMAFPIFLDEDTNIQEKDSGEYWDDEEYDEEGEYYDEDDYDFLDEEYEDEYEGFAQKFDPRASNRGTKSSSGDNILPYSEKHVRSVEYRENARVRSQDTLNARSFKTGSTEYTQ